MCMEGVTKYEHCKKIKVNLTHVGYSSCMTPFSIIESELLPSSYYGDVSNCKQLKELMGSLDECMHG